MTKRPALCVICCTLLACCLAACTPSRTASPPPDPGPSQAASQSLAAPQTAQPESSVVYLDEPEARALLDLMEKTIRDADSLSWRSAFTVKIGASGNPRRRGSYALWMKKPGFVRMEGYRPEITGIFVADGETQRIYWPNGRQREEFEKAGPAAEDYEKNRLTSFKEYSLPARYLSPQGFARDLQAGFGKLAFEPGVFFGASGSLDKYVDCVRMAGSETVLGQQCDIVCISYMRGLREQFFYVAKSDHLPRRVRMVFHGTEESACEELITKVALNAPLSDDLFAWAPPEGWTRIKDALPDNDSLIKPGVAAPDFELASLDGRRIRLSDYRDKVVWLYFWAAG